MTTMKRQKNVDEILENWDGDEEHNDWYAVDRYIHGKVKRIYVGDGERAKEIAAERATGFGLVDQTGEPVEPGWDGEENMPFYRCVLIPSAEAKDYFDEIMDGLTDWITQAEAAKILGVSRGRVSQLASNGQLDMLGKLVSRADVERRAKERPGAGRPPWK